MKFNVQNVYHCRVFDTCSMCCFHPVKIHCKTFEYHIKLIDHEKFDEQKFLDERYTWHCTLFSCLKCVSDGKWILTHSFTFFQQNKLLMVPATTFKISLALLKVRWHAKRLLGCTTLLLSCLLHKVSNFLSLLGITISK